MRVTWVLIALAGVLLVAGVTLAASTLSTQTIGLSNEPLTAGDELSPAATPGPTATATPGRIVSERARRTRPRPPRASSTPAATPTATAPPVIADDDGEVDDDNSGSGSDDSGQGRGRGRGRGRGGDDDD